VRCAILDDYQGVALSLADWASLDGVQARSFPDPIPYPAIADALAGFEIVVAMRERTRFDAALLARLPALRLLVTTGMRNASIDLDAAAARGVAVCGTPILGTPTPELAWGLILSLVRHIPAEVAGMRAGKRWQPRIGVGLAGKTLGVIGLGKIGATMARLAAAFGMATVAWSPNLTDARAAAAGASRAPSLLALMAQADIATVHMVLAPATRGLVDGRALAAMKPEAYLVNTSRGPLVDEAALVAALSDGRIAGAALDVFDTEPLPPGHPFRTLPNVIATPHVGYVTRENYRGFYDGAVADIAAWRAGRMVRVLGKGVISL